MTSLNYEEIKQYVFKILNIQINDNNFPVILKKYFYLADFMAKKLSYLLYKLDQPDDKILILDNIRYELNKLIILYEKLKIINLKTLPKFVNIFYPSQKELLNNSDENIEFVLFKEEINLLYVVGEINDLIIILLILTYSNFIIGKEINNYLENFGISKFKNKDMSDCIYETIQINKDSKNNDKILNLIGLTVRIINELF